MVKSTPSKNIPEFFRKFQNEKRFKKLAFFSPYEIKFNTHGIFKCPRVSYKYWGVVTASVVIQNNFQLYSGNVQCESRRALPGRA